MSHSKASRDWFSARTRWLIWAIYLALWTTALLLPLPASDDWRITPLNVNVKFVISKSLHVAAYAVLVALSGWAAPPLRFRWLMMYALMLHAGITEWLQGWAIAGRYGSVADVMYDQIGIALGLVLSWRAWSAPGAREDSSGSV